MMLAGITSTTNSLPSPQIDRGTELLRNNDCEEWYWGEVKDWRHSHILPESKGLKYIWYRDSTLSYSGELCLSIINPEPADTSYFCWLQIVR